jgi:hypothetical protein
VNKVSRVAPEAYTHLKGIIEIADLAQAVQELIDSGLVIFDKRIEGHHVLFFGIRWLVRQILEHLCYLLHVSKQKA